LSGQKHGYCSRVFCPDKNNPENNSLNGLYTHSQSWEPSDGKKCFPGLCRVASLKSTFDGRSEAADDTGGLSLKREPEQRSALNDSDIARLLEFFQLLDRWDRERGRDAKVM
jgi:hypothetical protein